MLDRAAAGEHPKKVEDDYQRKYYAPFVTVIACIKKLFEQNDYEMYATLEQLLIQARMGKSFEEECKRC